MHRKNFRALPLRPLALATLCLAGGFASQAFAGQAYLSGLSSSQTHDRFIVKYRNGSTESRDAAALGRSLTRAASAVRASDPSARGQSRAIGLRHLRRGGLGADVIVSSHKLDRATAETLMRRLASDPNVEYVEVDRLLRPTMVPNDPSFATAHWHYKAPVAGAYGINVPTAWDKATGSGIVVAVLDTGSTAHADLEGTTVPGYDFVADAYNGNDGDGRDSNSADPGDWRVQGGCSRNPQDWNYSASNSTWHGTHVSGTIAAATNNGIGVAGVAHGARVQHVRVLGRCGGYTSDIADGIVWASGGSVAGAPTNPTPAKVVNLSLGGYGSCEKTTQDAINGAVGRGTTIVISAGNSGANASQYTPASCNNVVTVGASSRDGLRVIRPNWWSSNYGAAVDIAAPGMDIMSTVNTGKTSPGNEGYAAWDGTSMAAPHVSGVVALMQSVRPSGSLLTPAQIEQLFKDSATPFPSQPDYAIGAGILNADASVRAAIVDDIGGGDMVQTYTNNTLTNLIDRGTITSSITVSGRTGNASATSQVSVDITHTYRGDLRIELIAPDSSVYLLKASAPDSADDVKATYTVNLSSEGLNGTWRLRVADVWAYDTGTLNSWSLRF